jgi:enoyl-CoA hydratase
MSTQIEFSAEGGIGRLTFRDEKGVNVISTPFLKLLDQRLDEAGRDESVRVLILSGAGKTFLAGADIEEMSKASPDAGRSFSELGKRVFDKLAYFEPAVTIAAINGAALGGGCEVTLACDLRIMSNAAKIGMPEVKLGLIPGWAGTQRSLLLVGPARAKRLVFTGVALDAKTAVEIGLVNEAVEPDQLLPATEKLAREILANGPTAVRLAKRAMAATEKALLAAGQHNETAAFVEAFAGEEGREGCRAFLEKRKANWA